MGRQQKRRKASALVVVLFVIGLTMTLSYAMIRMQHSVAKVQINSGLSATANQTAMSASMIALKKIKEGSWGGPDSTLTGSLGTNETYLITYTSGDSSLDPSHVDWADNPYRITIVAKSTITDAGGSGVTAEHSETFVARLVPEQLESEPSDWATFQNYTIYQTGTGNIKLDPPISIVGPVKLQGQLKLPQHYPIAFEETSNDLLFIVINSSNLTSEEQKRKSSFESWGFDIKLLSAYASQSSYENEKTLYEVAYVSEEVSSGNVGAKFSNFQTGVVNEVRALYDEFGISNAGSVSTETWAWVMDNDHYITSPYSIGSLQFHDLSDQGTYLGGNWADDLRVLVQWDQGSKNCLAILSESAAIDQSAGIFTAGRRVSLPIAGDSYNWDSLNSAGRNIIRRSIEWAATYEPQERFFRDLRALAYTTDYDNRPFTGTVNLDLTEQIDSVETVKILNEWLGLPVNDVPATLHPNWVLPTAYSSYRIYEGGPEYNVQVLTANTITTDLSPDPATNPLGIYYYDGVGDLTISSNVNIEGTLISTQNVKFDGTNIHLTAHDIPSLDGSNAPVRLPTLICKDLELTEESSGSITGLVAVFNDSFLKKGGVDNAFTITGRFVFANKLELLEHTSWHALNYLDLYKVFDTQESDMRFPRWIASNQSISLTPRVQIKPDPTDVTYHWLEPISGEPIFVPPTGSSGFRFQIIDWQ